MRRITLASPTDFTGWRNAARQLIGDGDGPEQVVWEISGEGKPGLDFPVPEAPGRQQTGLKVPRSFIAWAETTILHREPERFTLLYHLIWRLQAEPALLQLALDPLVARLSGMAKAVRRDIHKMHAFVRFRSIMINDGEIFIAWFEPDHHIVEAASPFFQRRFAAMRWSILTPERSAHWDGQTLHFEKGVERTRAPTEDALDELWRTYYASIFNPARLKLAMMRSEMPKKYWRNLPEARLIKPLAETALRKTADMLSAKAPEQRSRKQRSVFKSEEPAHQPDGDTIDALRRQAGHCRACQLWEPATQTVFGEGPEGAEVVFVGEQPGDTEDLTGQPFVGPAGKVLDRAFAEAGIDRSRVYLTNAVKHFKFTPQGKRRIHARPNAGEISQCRWWLKQELTLIRPKLIVALGATAIHGIIGHAMPVKASRGVIIPIENGGNMLVTIHPSYLLRIPGEDNKAREFGKFVDDLRKVTEIVGKLVKAA